MDFRCLRECKNIYPVWNIEWVVDPSLACWGPAPGFPFWRYDHLEGVPWHFLCCAKRRYATNITSLEVYSSSGILYSNTNQMKLTFPTSCKNELLLKHMMLLAQLRYRLNGDMNKIRQNSFEFTCVFFCILQLSSNFHLNKLFLISDRAYL